MSTISHQDCEAMLDCIARLNRCEEVGEFIAVFLQEMAGLIGSEHTTFNYIAPTIPEARVVAFPDGPKHAVRERTFARYTFEHPLLNRYLATGDGSAFKISDFLSESAYHATGLYQAFYRELRYEDQIAAFLFPPGLEIIGIAFNRGRRSFTERERKILNLMRPRIAEAYRHVSKFAVLKRGLGLREYTPGTARTTSVLLNRADRPIHFAPQAQRWMAHFFPDRSRDPSRLPAQVAGWLGRAPRAGQPRKGTLRESTVLQRVRDGQRLQLRVVPALGRSEWILILSLETVPAAAHSSLASRLTSRQVEVLLQVEQGKTNSEVAVALGISPLTVRLHLERIFEKLRVSNRTGAVTMFRRMVCRKSPAPDTDLF